MTTGTCIIPDCRDRDGRPSRRVAHGYCRKHYQRLYRHGDPLAVHTPGPKPRAHSYREVPPWVHSH